MLSCYVGWSPLFAEAAMSVSSGGGL
eukprot:SAG31_NODE_30953_length_374_cov_0.752727_1_plen_25_part_01